MVERFLLCIGSINMDLSINVTKHPVLGETVVGSEVRFSAGGKGLNQAVAAARQGLRVRFMGAVGRDIFGEQLLDHARAESIDTGGVFVRSDHKTGMAFVVVGANGDNTIVVSPGANGALSVTDIESHRDWISQSAGVLLQNEAPLVVVEKAMQIAQQDGIPVYYNPAPIVEGCQSLLEYSEVIIVNETEAEQLTGLRIAAKADAFTAGEQLRSRSGQIVIVTLGEQGAVCVDEYGNQHEAAGLPVSAIDTTSAGDTFVGAFLSQRLGGLEIPDALAYACVAGSLAVTKAGAQESIPTLYEVQARLRSDGFPPSKFPNTDRWRTPRSGQLP